MKKSSKTSISQKEYELIEKINKSGIALFSAGDITKLLGWEKKTAYKIINNLKRKDVILGVTGRYFISSLFGQHDPLSIASQIAWPAYISFWTALNYYKLTEQLPLTIFVVTTKQKRDLKFESNRIKFVRISKDRFFGYRKVDDTVIAEKEKALIDSLLLPRYSGGVREISKCLKNSWGELDKKILVEYALRMKNKSLLKRLGYLIETGNLGMDEKLIEKLQENIGRGYSKLDLRSTTTPPSQQQ